MVQRLSPDGCERLLRKYKTKTAVAEAIGVSEATIRRWLKPGPQPPNEHPDTIKLHRAAQQAKGAANEIKALRSRIVRLEDELNFMHAAAAHKPVLHTPASRTKTGKHTADPVFVVSDLHFGERVTLEESLGTNEYNIDIARKRMQKCWDHMLWLRKDMARTNTCDNTLLSFNGDTITGDIHDELRETNELGMLGQCELACDLLAPGIVAMAEATPGVLHITCIGGNHGRVTPKQQIKNGTQHSAEHLGIYGPLRRQLGDMGGKIAWHIPEAERFKINVQGWQVSLQHGTMIRSGGGIGGVLVPMTRWVTRSNDADLYIFGHFHEADAYGKIVKNGSLIGPSAYTSWLGIEDRPPEQVGFLLSEMHKVRRFERVSVK